MSDIIQLLPNHVANQIAAGEVVQRPSSVVKELLENSVDAGATSIKLLLKDAGKTLIQVIDNGKGMSDTDARLCFERHATSKIRNAQDLFNLNTKGFRGEALASIAAIAHVELKTKQKNKELGTQLKIGGNNVVSQEIISTAKGTSISVKNLFYNIPARRIFLKSDSIETRHIIDEFQRVALAHPSISFLFYHNNKEMYHLKESNFRKRIVAIFGIKMNDKLVPVDEKTNIVTIRGFITKSEFSKKRRGEQFFFVNHRFVKNAYLNHAVVNAFEGLIENGYYPSYFLYLELPPKSIDINIHPTKTEIKFDNEKALYAILKSTVKHSLGQYNVAPILDFNRDSTLETPYNFKDKPITSVPKITVDPNFNPFKKEDNTAGSPVKKQHQNYKKEVANWESLYTSVHPFETIEQEKLFESSQEIETKKTFQIQKKYILSSIKSGIVLINQSLAHQRILYEEFLENNTAKQINSQQLLFPVIISFSISDMEIIKTIKADLESVGFVFDSFSKEHISITGVPISITESKVSSIFEQLIDDIKLEVPNVRFYPLDIMAKSFAKSLAIKTGVILSEKEQETVVNNLFLCKNPSVSPFKKPVFKTLTLSEIDTIFNS